MKPEIKKQIILHLPYLAFIYLFGKVGQAFRLAQGADLSAKLLHIGQGFSAAFASAAPSFQPGRCRKNRKPSSGAKITCRAQMNAAFDREVRVMP